MDLLNEESFVAKSTKTGKVVNFGSRETRDAQLNPAIMKNLKREMLVHLQNLK